MILKDFSFIESVYIVAALVTAIESYVLSFIVISKNISSAVNKSYALMGFFIGSWSLSLFLCQISQDKQTALFYNRLLHLNSVFIAISFYFFTCKLLEINKNRLLYFGLSFALLLSFLCFSPLIILDMASKYSFKLWPVPGMLYQLYLIYFSFFSYFSLFLIFRGYRGSTGNRREQLKFIFVSLFIGFAGGSTNFAYFYNVPIPPIGNIFVFTYVLILAYAIVKYRLMDIRLAISNTAIFVGVYAFVLGIPFLYGYKYNQWEIATWEMLVFATAGPILFNLLRKRAEEQILQEENRIKKVLTSTSAGINVVKELAKLLRITLDALIKNLYLDHASVYIFDETQGAFILQIAEPQNGTHVMFNNDCPFIKQLKKKKHPVLYEEMIYLSRNKDQETDHIDQIIAKMQELSAAVAVPLLRDKDLLGFIALGDRAEKKPYSKGLTDSLLIVANEVALGIENAKFFENIKLTQQQLFQAEKMATIGTMADGLSHQINNRFHALSFIAGDAMDTIHLNQDEPMPDKVKKIMTELEHAFVRVQENVMQGGEIVQGLLKYTRKGETGFTAVDIDAVLKASLEMAQYKIKSKELDILRGYDPAGVPKIKGNFTQLQEVFFNLIDNGYDAMMQRKNEKREPGYHPTLKVSVSKENSDVWVVFEDNGIGVKPEDTRKLFTPFFTTKLSSKRGTGLGLYVIKKIVEDNHGGKVEMVSKYMEGTQMKLCLPAAAG